jgi:hypothetical protein
MKQLINYTVTMSVNSFLTSVGYNTFIGSDLLRNLHSLSVIILSTDGASRQTVLDNVSYKFDNNIIIIVLSHLISSYSDKSR